MRDWFNTGHKAPLEGHNAFFVLTVVTVATTL